MGRGVDRSVKEVAPRTYLVSQRRRKIPRISLGFQLLEIRGTRRTLFSLAMVRRFGSFGRVGEMFRDVGDRLGCSSEFAGTIEPPGSGVPPGRVVEIAGCFNVKLGLGRIVIGEGSAGVLVGSTKIKANPPAIPLGIVRRGGRREVGIRPLEECSIPRMVDRAGQVVGCGPIFMSQSPVTVAVRTQSVAIELRSTIGPIAQTVLGTTYRSTVRPQPPQEVIGLPEITFRSLLVLLLGIGSLLVLSLGRGRVIRARRRGFKGPRKRQSEQARHA